VAALEHARSETFSHAPEKTTVPPRTTAIPRSTLADLLAEAERMVAAGRLAEAQALLRRAVDVDPHSPVAFRRLFEVASALAARGEGTP
jgi:hypothetical protein